MRRPSLLGLAFALALATAAIAGPPAGALHTTDVNGVRVNQMHFESKRDVYISGGPNSNAGPILDAGNYYFMVTDPSGKVLLSTDNIMDRQFSVDSKGLLYGTSTHATGIDFDDGDQTVQLWPYNDTPNPGGVYKVWITLKQYYDPLAPTANFGFVEKYCKTDTFKVRTPGCDCE